MKKKLDNSWLNRSSAVIAQGALTNSKRPEAYVKGVFPTHLTRGEGCYVYDYVGNRYLDFVSGLGCNILGYGHPKITEAVTAVLSRGPSLSLPSTLEVEVAEKLCWITEFDRVKFVKSGTEACMAAVRIAKAYEDGSVFSDGYHGHSDAFVSLMEPGLGKYQTLKSYELSGNALPHCKIFIVEPLKLDLEKDKIKTAEWMSRKKTMIFDEIVTGFRVPQNFIYKEWEMRPDILCLGKALANGYPLAAVLMDKKYAENDYFVSGTYYGEMVSLAACKATLEELEKKKISELFYYGNRLMDGINNIVKDIGVELRGYGTRGMWDNEQRETALVMQELCKSGVLIGRAHFFNYAHLEAGIEEWFLNILTDVVTKIKRGGVTLEGDAPRNSFRR